ncbi:MAG TPA: PEP-CTERM sorting domain-containing protein [Falsiroseomonas sp.]|jgi:hypothetical protein|nr:PEP-CTERM sorting domain-containing protein [Falsiroseomonas sp.]
MNPVFEGASSRLRSATIAGALALGMLAGAAPAAVADVTFTIGNIAVSSNASDGLIVNTGVKPTPISFTLDVGQTTSVELFAIWTNETNVGGDDIFNPQPITLDLGFTAPLPGFTTDQAGVTGGLIGFAILSGPGYGYVDWDNSDSPLLVNFTSNVGDGTLRILLDEPTFNRGDSRFLTYGNTNPGETFGAIVSAQFTLVEFNEPTDPTNVPEPLSLALFGTGLLGLGLVRRRRNA